LQIAELFEFTLVRERSESSSLLSNNIFVLLFEFGMVYLLTVLGNLVLWLAVVKLPGEPSKVQEEL